MGQTTMNCKLIDGFTTLRIEGELRASTLYSLYLLTRGCSEQGCKGIIVDVSGDLSISDELKDLHDGKLGWKANGTILVAVGGDDHFKQLRSVLGEKQKIWRASSVDEAIRMLDT